MIDLRAHWFWGQTNPGEMHLTRVSKVPSELNPFTKENVLIRVATPGEVPYHKWPMARDGLLNGIETGAIRSDTIVVEATSGNTGHAMAVICTALGLQFVPIISKDIPSSKVDVMRALGSQVSTQTPMPGETTAECARRLGAQDGWYNPDQYGGEWNPSSHEKHLAPEIFGQSPVSVFVAPGGTMGTCLGIARYARSNKVKTKVVPVMCAPGEEVPAARTLERVKKDIRLHWEEYFSEEDIQFGTRGEAFLLSFLSWRFLPVQPGPSFGLAFAGALRFLWEHREAGTLEQFRESDGRIHVVVFGPDDYRPYSGLYLGERFYTPEDQFERTSLLAALGLP